MNATIPARDIIASYHACLRFTERYPVNVNWTDPDIRDVIARLVSRGVPFGGQVGGLERGFQEESEDRVSDERFELVDVFVERLVAKTKLAALCETEDGDEVWIPWSQIDPSSDLDEGSEHGRDGESGTIYIPRWLAEEKGLD